jgi:hypothetical protein
LSAQVRLGGDTPPSPARLVVGIQHDHSVKPTLQVRPALATPTPGPCPLPQLTYGHEGDAPNEPIQPCRQGPAKLPLDTARRHICVEDYVSHC